jgi:hypothetical protein
LAPVLLALLFGFVSTVAVVEIWPSFGAQVANHLRDLLGPQVVAHLETIIFQAQDSPRLWEHQYGLQQAEAPWESETGPFDLTPFAQVAVEGPHLSPEPAQLTPAPSAPTETAPSDEQSEDHKDLLPTKEISPTPPPSPQVWQLPTLRPFGSMEGEGVWLPYLYD